jgi:hypothetical protein
MEFGVAQADLALAQAQLRQPRSGPDENREGARRNFGIKRAGIPRPNGIEFLAAVGDHAGEHIDAAGGALRIGRG